MLKYKQVGHTQSLLYTRGLDGILRWVSVCNCILCFCVRVFSVDSVFSQNIWYQISSRMLLGNPSNFTSLVLSTSYISCSYFSTRSGDAVMSFMDSIRCCILVPRRFCRCLMKSLSWSSRWSLRQDNRKLSQGMKCCLKGWLFLGLFSFIFRYFCPLPQLFVRLFVWFWYFLSPSPLVPAHQMQTHKRKDKSKHTEANVNTKTQTQTHKRKRVKNTNTNTHTNANVNTKTQTQTQTQTHKRKRDKNTKTKAKTQRQT